MKIEAGTRLVNSQAEWQPKVKDIVTMFQSAMREISSIWVPIILNAEDHDVNVNPYD